MQLGYIGLGKMGFNMVGRLLKKEYDIVVFDSNGEMVERAKEKGAFPTSSLKEMVTRLATPRILWIMVPHQAVDSVLEELVPMLSVGDTIIDGGNSPYKESIRRAGEISEKGFSFVDVGVSGGPSGAEEGACLMIGGERTVYNTLEGLWKDIATEEGYGYMGKSGSGHFVKMVHNGIEYGMMQAIAEGFSVMKESSFELDLKEVARVYDKKSVVESRLIAWLGNAFQQEGPDLSHISGTVKQSGEGLWTLEAAHELGVSVPVIKDSVEFRKQSENSPSFTGKVLSALRNQFGGHEVKNK